MPRRIASCWNSDRSAWLCAGEEPENVKPGTQRQSCAVDATIPASHQFLLGLLDDALPSCAVE